MSLNVIEDCDLGEGTEVAEFTALRNCVVGKDTTIWRFVNMYGADIGDDCMIGSLVEIQDGVVVGDRSRIQSHAFICSLVDIGDDVFVSHGVKFVNDRYPPSGDANQWEGVTVEEGAAIGTNATILPVTIGKNAMVGAGAVVTEDVPPNAIVAGNPAEIVGYQSDE